MARVSTLEQPHTVNARSRGRTDQDLTSTLFCMTEAALTCAGFLAKRRRHGQVGSLAARVCCSRFAGPVHATVRLVPTSDRSSTRAGDTYPQAAIAACRPILRQFLLPTAAAVLSLRVATVAQGCPGPATVGGVPNGGGSGAAHGLRPKPPRRSYAQPRPREILRQPPSPAGDHGVIRLGSGCDLDHGVNFQNR